MNDPIQFEKIFGFVFSQFTGGIVYYFWTIYKLPLSLFSLSLSESVEKKSEWEKVREIENVNVCVFIHSSWFSLSSSSSSLLFQYTIEFQQQDL